MKGDGRQRSRDAFGYRRNIVNFFGFEGIEVCVQDYMAVANHHKTVDRQPLLLNKSEEIDKSF